METIYNFSVKDIDLNDVSLEKYKNKVLLIVNVASYCGLTYQYKSLEDIYKKYKDKGFEILGFPCNQFALQEPGSNEEIKNFCDTSYGVTFNIMNTTCHNTTQTTKSMAIRRTETLRTRYTTLHLVSTLNGTFCV